MHGIWNAVKWQIRRRAVSRFLYPLPSSISRDQTELISYEAMRIKHYDCVCILASVIRHANRIYFIRSIILSSVAVRSYHIFPPYLINSTTFGEKMLLNIKCVCVCVCVRERERESLFFFTTCLKRFYSTKNSARNYHKCIWVFM
jgi:hypothetical protein